MCCAGCFWFNKLILLVLLVYWTWVFCICLEMEWLYKLLSFSWVVSLQCLAKCETCGIYLILYGLHGFSFKTINWIKWEGNSPKQVEGWGYRFTTHWCVCYLWGKVHNATLLMSSSSTATSSPCKCLVEGEVVGS